MLARANNSNPQVCNQHARSSDQPLARAKNKPDRSSQEKLARAKKYNSQVQNQTQPLARAKPLWLDPPDTNSKLARATNSSLERSGVYIHEFLCEIIEKLQRKIKLWKSYVEKEISVVSYPAVAPSVGTTFAFTGGFKGFESRRLIMNGVMKALTDDSIYVIGICGMRGVGKTTMVKEVAKKAEEKKMFDKIVMVVVSQNPNLINIQVEIAKILGFELSGGNNLFARAGN
ncbi:hypothetical protein HYC85_022295 [Camellia sinensis]|uniref:NB-ARC domain-containing protein n=1 Tax=Camellia sinensis TaxID=4442 RepID=A0A7J7GP03_CAMSI|nr:hypothetical protein HYC85_022295 [Camellia sinensis]